MSHSSCSHMSPPSLTLCFLSCFPLSLFTSVVVYLCLLPLTSVHINRPLPLEGRQFVPPIPGSHTHSHSFGMCGLVSLPAAACLSECGGVSLRSCMWVQGGGAVARARHAACASSWQ